VGEEKGYSSCPRSVLPATILMHWPGKLEKFGKFAPAPLPRTILKEIDDLAGGYTAVHSYISEYEPGKIWNAWEEGMGRIYEWVGSKD